MNSSFQPTRSQPARADMLTESVTALELPGVLEEVAAHAFSDPGKALVLATSPETELEEIRAQLALVAELKEMNSTWGALGLVNLVPMEGILSKLQSPASVLDSEELLVVGDCLDTASTTRRRLADLEERFELLRDAAQRFVSLAQVRDRIGRVLDEHGLVRSDASPRLKKIREGTRAIRQRIQKRLEGTVRDRDLSRVIQEDYVTMRNDRYVILLRPEFKGLLDGIVHDHSRSGASVYVEPLEVVELNNQVASLMDEERDEIRRIFTELTEEIRFVRFELQANYELLAWLDAFQARALYATHTGSVSPELVDRGFKILGARHPLLLAAEEAEVVPMDIIQDPLTLATVISGANMGGKTVALKIAGLYPLMTRCGMMVPAREGTEIHPFARIMADIGDEQDIRGRISSFSGHMLRIKAIVETASAGDLVLLDELGGATDPEEGSALAMSILDELIRRGTRVVVTTHLTQLKAYALGRESVNNVSVEFHPETLKPTFRLLYNLPGESHAIVTAERIGLPPSLIHAARGYLDKSAGGSSQLIRSLHEKHREAEERGRELEEKQEELQTQLDRIRSSREEIVEEFRRKASAIIRRAETEIADLQRSLKSKKIKDRPKPGEELKRVRNEIERELGIPLEKPSLVPQPGARVRITSLGKEGIVQSIRDKEEVEVAVGKLKVRADCNDLIILDEGTAKKSSSKKERIRVDIPIATPRREVNVVGLRVDDALPVVERAVDEALRGGLSSFNIIHGKGTGRLKQAIWEHLSGHSLVQGFHVADIYSGGEGVTVVELAAD